MSRRSEKSMQKKLLLNLNHENLQSHRLHLFHQCFRQRPFSYEWLHDCQTMRYSSHA